MRIATILLLIALTFTCCQRGPSDIKLPSLIGNNMLLQQKTNARLWGTATPGHKISVSASWNAMGQSTAGKDGKFVKALAQIVNNEVVVSSPAVPEPVSVRYCWHNGSVASLFNSAELPASQFRTKD